MATFYDRVQFSTTTTGTGTLTVGSAVPAYRTPAQAGVPNGAVQSYVILDGSNWEVGAGTYASAGATLARTTIYESSNNGSAISLSGNAVVAFTLTATDLAGFSGAVSSVAGRTGAVTLSQSDITGLHTSDAPAFNGISIPSIALGTRTFLTEYGGDTWLTFNAYYDGSRWQRVNPAQTAFALNAQSNNVIPNQSLRGIAVWRAVAGTNPIGASFGVSGGWEMIDLRSESKDFVCAGFGIEIDGNGTTPFARLVHYSASNNPPVRSGIVKNLAVGLASVDDNTKPIWFAGLKDDSFVIERGAAGQTTASGLQTFMLLDSSGNVVLSSVGAVTLPSGSTGQRPGSPAAGMMRYNSTTGRFESYAGSSWFNHVRASGETGTVDLTGAASVSVPAPTASSNACTKAYADGLLTGLYRAVTGTTDTPTATDNNKTIEFTGSSSQTVTVNHLGTGVSYEVWQTGTGIPQLTAGSGITLVSPNPSPSFRPVARYGSLVVKCGADTTKVIVEGAMA